MKTSTRYLALVLLLLPTFASAQPAPLDRSEILGRLTQGESASYIAHLVKTRGVNFSPSADFVASVKLAGGDGLLIERLSSSDLVPAISSSNHDRPFQHLARCAELIHVGDNEQAQPECLAAIDENPESAWPLMATFHALRETRALNKDDFALVRRAIALDPNLISAHWAMFSSELPGVERNQEAQKIAELEHAEASDTYASAKRNGDICQIHGAPVAVDLPPDVREAVEQQILSSLQKYPDIAAVRLSAACSYGFLGDLDRLQSDSQEAFRLEPGNPALHLDLAHFYSFGNNQVEELAQYREAIRIAPYLESSRSWLTRALVREQRPNDAIREWKDFLTLSPGNVNASDSLVSLYLQGEDRKSAISELRRSLKTFSDAIPDQAKYVQTRLDDLDRLGSLLSDNSEFDAAVEQYTFLLRFMPDSSFLHNNLGNVFYAQHRCEDASHEYLESLRLQPDFPPAHNNLALCLLITQQTDEAIAQFQRALELELEPSNYETRIMLGAAFLQKGYVSDAMAQFQQVLEEQPEEAKVHTLIAHAYSVNKNFSSAITELKHALSIKPDPQTENELAWIYATADDPKFRNSSEALRLAKHAVQTSPQPDPAILDTLAEALLQNGQPAEALKTEQQAASLAPQNPEIQNRLPHFQSAYSSSLVSKQ